MAGSLTVAEIKSYRDRGFLTGLRVLSEDKTKRLRADLEGIEDAQGFALDKAQCNKSYLLFDWADELVHHPAVLDAVESLIGPDILCLMTNLFTKEANSGSFVSMHQDAAYWGVDADDVVTAWIALSPATAESGVMKVEPGSHKSLRTQVNTYSSGNLLSRGQTIPDDELEPDQQVYMELSPGEMSLHHFKLVHGSDPNQTEDRRIGLAIRYVAAKAETTAEGQSALLVRGESHSQIELETRTSGMTKSEKYRHHTDAVTKLFKAMMKSDKDTPFAERVRLVLMRSLAPILLRLKKRTT
nr:phytanoyl-CoA dioxygenase family protein [Hyphomonas sp. Mor2]